METKIYQAGPPRQGEWVLQWRSGTMPAPAFWYYSSQDEAESARAEMLNKRGEYA